MNTRYIDYKNEFVNLCIEFKRAQLNITYPYAESYEAIEKLTIEAQKAAGAILTFCNREAYWFPDSTTNSILKTLGITSTDLAMGRKFVENI